MILFVLKNDWIKNLLPILFVLIISSCSKEIPIDQVVEIDGIHYEIHSPEKPFTGVVFQRNENGQLKYKSTIKNGKLEGPFEVYYENGQLESKRIWKDGEEFKPPP